jgi:hypothetical protein
VTANNLLHLSSIVIILNGQEKVVKKCTRFLDIKDLLFEDCQ